MTRTGNGRAASGRTSCWKIRSSNRSRSQGRSRRFNFSMLTVDHLLSLTVDAVTLGSLYVLVALGYVLIYSVLGIFHLVHGDVVVLGGMVGIGVLHITGVPEGNV